MKKVFWIIIIVIILSVLIKFIAINEVMYYYESKVVNKNSIIVFNINPSSENIELNSPFFFMSKIKKDPFWFRILYFSDAPKEIILSKIKITQNNNKVYEYKKNKKIILKSTKEDDIYVRISVKEYSERTRYVADIATDDYINCELEDIKIEINYLENGEEKKINSELKLQKEENLFTIIDYIKFLASM